jgi:hypothetical protein
MVPGEMRNKTMTNMPKLSARAKMALEVLADNGRFVQRLERDYYTGRGEVLQTRLLGPGRSVVKGVGLGAFYELKNLGFLTSTDEGNLECTYWKLNTAGA